jgi:DNA-binding NtrC family response regulator
MGRVLVVDDDESTVELIIEVLSREHEVRGAADAREAKELMDVFKPEVVVLDKRLKGSGQDGDDLLKDNAFDGAVVIMATALQATPEFRSEMMELGALYVIQKPFNVTEFVSMVSRSCDYHRRTHEITVHSAECTINEELMEKLRKARNTVRAACGMTAVLTKHDAVTHA